MSGCFYCESLTIPGIRAGRRKNAAPLNFTVSVIWNSGLPVRIVNSMIDLKRSNRQRFEYEAISSHVEEIERIYSKSNIRITHQLLSLLNDAKDLAAQWAEGNIVETDMNKLFNSLHIERIYDGIKLLDGYDKELGRKRPSSLSSVNNGRITMQLDSRKIAFEKPRRFTDSNSMCLVPIASNTDLYQQRDI